MNPPLTSRSISPGLEAGRLEVLIVIATLTLTVAALASPLALPIAVSIAVFVLAALRFKPLLLVVVLFLPITPFMNWDFPIKDLSTLIRFSFFAGVLVYRASHREPLWG